VERLVRVAAEQQPLPRFLLISSLAAREPDLSPYAASKRRGERVLALEAGRMPWTVLRPPAIYGPGDRELLPLFRWMRRGIAPLPGPADARLSLLYVEDLAEAVAELLNCRYDQGAVFELHDGKDLGYTWSEVIDIATRLRARRIIRIPVPGLDLLARANLTAARILGYAPMLTPGKLRELRHRNWVCDNTALNSATGWTPRIPLEEGLRRTLDWKVQPDGIRQW
jgi:nucleoside-diphosphate-sugar epimerase